MTESFDLNERKALLKNALVAINDLQAKLDASEQAAHEPIAITGMGCRFPGGANSLEAYWNLLHNGVDAVRPVPADRWDTHVYDSLKLAHPIAWYGGFLDGIDQFDPQFFGISPREANSIDPQQRLVLEVTWEALENAGQAPDRLSGSQTGVFMGATTNDYAQLVRSGDPALMDIYAATGSAMNVIAGRVAYLLGLHGPSITVDTACSSSLVAIHLACQSLRSGECDLALAGGVNATLTPEAFICFAGWGMMAPDGHCKTFDAGADGFVRGEGCGMLVLKRLSDAVTNGDRILAVIRGSAVNQDGRSSGLTVPSGRAQQAVIRTALKNAGVEPAQVGYVETHGTGTSLGDPIEIEALGAAFGVGRNQQPLTIGSVKTNIGHLESASGVAGLIKSVLVLRNAEFPPHLHLKERSQQIPWPDFPIDIPTSPTPWPAGDNLRLAGVSSFGFSGTNAHIILEEAPRPAVTERVTESSTHLLVLSAKNQTALAELAGRYAHSITSSPELPLARACRTSSVGRQHFSYRLAVVGESGRDIVAALTTFAAGETPAGSTAGQAERGAGEKIAFLFTGQGAQWAGMGKQLYEEQPLFREILDQCDALLRPYLELPLLSVLFPAGDAAPLLDHTTYTQPAMFALQYALAKLWQSWGVEPFALLGHSVGEYAAACVAGVFSLEDGLKLIATRARLMGSLPAGGQMAAVFTHAERVAQVLSRLNGQVSIAAINGPENVVISGAGPACQAALEAFEQAGIQTRRMNVSHAFHSGLMDPILDEFERLAGAIQYKQPAVPIISNVSGQAETERILSPLYWRQHIRQPVRFYQGIQSLYQQGCRIFIEIGPNPVLIGMGQRCLPESEKTLRWLPALRKGRPDLKQTLESLGALWVGGVEIDWKAFYRGVPEQPVDLPTYPFQRERYWLPSQDSYSSRALSEAGQNQFLTHRVDLAAQKGVSVWEGEVSFEKFPYLRDHCVQETAVLPASAFVEIALEAARQLWGSGGLKLTGVENRKVLLLREDQAFTLQVVFTQQPDAPTQYQIFSRPRQSTLKPVGWTLNHSGSIALLGPNSVPPSIPDVPAIRNRCTQEISSAAFYQAQNEKGNQWGPAFQGMARLWRGNGEVISQVDAPESLELAHTHFHPALADASGHSLVAALPPVESGSSRTGAFVGGRIDEIRFYGSPQSRRIWSHAEFSPAVQQSENNLVGNVRVWDDQGNVISETIGAHLVYFDQEAQRNLFSSLGDWFYVPTWQLANSLQDQNGALPAPDSDSAQRWLIFADDQGVAEALAEKVRAAGDLPLLIFHNDEDAANPSAERWNLPLRQPGQLESLLSKVFAVGVAPVSKIIYLWGLDTPQPGQAGIADLETAAALGCESVLRIVQMIKQILPKTAPKIWLVTQNARCVNGNESDLAPAQAMLWGFGLSLAGEHADLWGGLVDLERNTPPAQAAQYLVLATRAALQEDQVAFRGGQLFVPRLTRKQDAAGSPELKCRPDGAYLITGGLGGLGLLVAQRLLERGARCLLLTGRSSLPERAAWDGLAIDSRQGRMAAEIRGLEATGATIVYMAADAGDEQQMRSGLEQFRQQYGLPIRGVVHTAGVPQYQAILEHTVAEMSAILRPKVAGAWLLHSLLEAEPLEFFVLFSSASTLLSSPLAASYAAGNAFLDALAYYRKIHALPALSINWGFWAEAGMVAKFAETSRADKRQAMKMITPQPGLRALEFAMGQDDPQVGIFPVDWSQWASPLANTKFFNELIQPKSQTAQSAPEQSISREAIQKAAPEERLHLLGKYLSKLVSRILDLPVGQLNWQEPITALGIDSLMALEIKNTIESDLQLTIPVMLLLKGSSVTNLVDALAVKLIDGVSSANTTATANLTASMEPAQSAQAGPVIPSRTFPQSYNQRTMWFLNLLAPLSSAYHVGFAAYIRSQVKIDALRQAVRILVQRHPALRTTFTLEGQNPVQIIGEGAEIDLKEINAAGASEWDLHEQVLADHRQPFDLERGPLVRVSLYTRGLNDYLLLITAHHIIMDGWSIGILLNDLEALYASLVDDLPINLPDLKVQYSDFIQWQADLLNSPAGEEMEKYWLEEFSGALPKLQLPLDHPRPEMHAFDGASLPFEINKVLAGQLKELVKTEGTTLFTALLSAYKVLLSLYSGQDEIIVGSPVSGRGPASFYGVIGNFINMVMVRSCLSVSDTYQEFLRDVQNKTISALEYQDYPFPLLVERLGVKREAGISPIFQVMFDFQRLQGFERLAPLFTPNNEGEKVSFGGMTLQPFYLPQQEGQFDLSLQVAETGETLSGVLKYNKDIFELSSIQRLQQDLIRLLEQFVANPAMRIPDNSFLAQSMELTEFLAFLRNKDIQVSVDQGRLKINAPAGTMTDALKAELIRRKPGLIELLQTMQQKNAQPVSPPIKPIPHFPQAALSFPQQRLWFLDQFEPGNTAYSIALAIKYEGQLDSETLEKCLNEIVRRHETLRTTFSTDQDSAPVQKIHPFSPQELPVQDFTHLAEAEKEPASLEFIHQQARIPFDLQSGPLFRACLVRTDRLTHYLFFNMHHIISDGWSTGVFLTELAALYQGFVSGSGNPLPELTVQFADYAAWQRQEQGINSQRAQLEYWTQKLSGKLPVLDLPTDHPRPVFQTFHGSTIRAVLSAELVSQLKQLCKQQEVTLFMMMLAAYDVLLYRYTGQEDLLVGTPIANRDQKEIEALIGFFVNTLVIRNDLTGNPAFTDFLTRVRETSLAALTNHGLPFEHIVEAIHPVRDTSYSPIFQVMFILQNMPIRTTTFNQLKASSIYPDSGASKYDLTLIVWESPEGMTCFFEYNTDLFEKSTIERMLGHYQTILAGICANPEQRIADLPLLTAQERRQILQEWNATGQEYPRGATIQGLFEAQVERTPEKVAIIAEEDQITYRELDRRANCLAHDLRANGVGTETLVGICLPRTIDMVVGLLAILKAGAAYVPLDPHFPPDRLAYMLEDSGAPLLLTHSHLAKLFSTAQVKRIYLDLETSALAQQYDGRLDGGAQPENLAYVIYTSGSTGRPKGVQVLQRGVVNFLTSMQRKPGITPGDILLSVTTLSFDIAGLELYLPLISGALLILVSSATAGDGSRLRTALEQSQATFMQATPATWRLLIAAGWQGSRQFKILCGGEALPIDLAAGLLERCGALWNMYGPTETTIWSTMAQISSPAAPITIGHPIANTQVYVLDTHQQPVPVGKSGELLIGGDGLARGYLNRPELTAEKFIPNPFEAQGNARLYRTGDLARYLADGQIEFLGRIDHQVKLRGFRIELGEIESVLALHPAVRQAVVVAREDTPGDKRLVAYLTVKTARAPTTSELRDFLHQRLPEYMIPALFVVLETFPLTPNSKVDRRALPAPETSRPDLAASYIAPRSEIEQTLASIWQQALKVEKVGINDNFFELGGHSLLIVQIHHQILQKFKTDLTIAQMFQFPTIQTLSQYLGRAEQPIVAGGPDQNIRDRAMMQKEAIDRQRKLSNRKEATNEPNDTE